MAINRLYSYYYNPNYLADDSHIRFAFKSGSNAICEKPLVLNPKQIDDLKSSRKREW